MKSLLAILFFTSIFVYAQNVNIIPQLKKIEAGKIDEAKRDLLDFKQLNSADPNVIFLEAVLEEDGEKSQKLYEAVYTNFPKSRFADAALFRSFSYFYALGLYKKAEGLKNLLKNEYPNSPYLKKTDKSFPQVDEMLVVDSSPYSGNVHDDYKFTIQVGAFGKYDNAEKLKQKLLADDFQVNISTKTINNLKLHVVTVGKFRTKNEAQNLLSVLDEDYSLKGRIVKIK